MKYDITYFIDKFSSIPEDNWTTDVFVSEDNKCCALGHCGVRYDRTTEEATALFRLFRNSRFSVVSVNDDEYPVAYPQTTPKQRVLAALRDLEKSDGK